MFLLLRYISNAFIQILFSKENFYSNTTGPSSRRKEKSDVETTSVCTEKLYDILNVKNAFVKSACYVTEYTA